MALRWWLVALSPVLVLVVVLGFDVVAGTPLPAYGDFAVFTGLPSGWGVVAVFAMMLLVGGYGEESGWRGYLLPHLQTRLIPLPATAIVATVWGGLACTDVLHASQLPVLRRAPPNRLGDRPLLWGDPADLALQPQRRKHPAGSRLSGRQDSLRLLRDPRDAMGCCSNLPRVGTFEVSGYRLSRRIDGGQARASFWAKGLNRLLPVRVLREATLASVAIRVRSRSTAGGGAAWVEDRECRL